MRKVLDGSNIARGRKNRTNIRKQVVRKPAILAQTMRRLILLTVGSGGLSTTAPGALAAGLADGGTGAGFGCDAGADGRTSVEPPVAGALPGHKS